MEFKIKKDKLTRTKVSRFEWKSCILRSTLSSMYLKKGSKKNTSKLFGGVPVCSSVVRVRNRCLVTGRSRSVFKFAKVSDLVLREQAIKGEIFGFIKSK